MGIILAAILSEGETAMTIQALITKIKTEKPNTFTNEWLLHFINEVEEKVYEELRKADDFVPYDTVDDTELEVPFPYDALYESYLKAKVDYANEEYPSYQLNADQFNSDFDSFSDWVVRTGQTELADIPARFRNTW